MNDRLAKETAQNEELIKQMHEELDHTKEVWHEIYFIGVTFKTLNIFFYICLCPVITNADHPGKHILLLYSSVQISY